MAIAKQLSVPYAEALLALAKQHDLVDAIADDMRGLAAVLQETPELGVFLANPLVKPAVKKAVLGKTLADKVNPFTLNFLNLLADRGRIIVLAAIADSFLALVRRLKNIALAEVRTTKPLSDAQQAAVVDKVKQITGAVDVELATHIDATLIGGVIIKVGSQVIDASIRGQLRRLSLQLV